MKKIYRNNRPAPMSADAYAGFLRLLLTPTSEVPRPSSDVDAYISHANRVEPLSDEVRRVLGKPLDHAA